MPDVEIVALADLIPGKAEAFAKKFEIEVTKKKFKGLYGAGTIEDEKVILLKPQTYMNLSGTSLRQFMQFYKILLKLLKKF